ncbi:DNA-binding transcriptional regulator, MerR family [Amycolatopsis regifaucium]|nr:DNA-binding transcriptional regulator, MerR family [Amycolatopsis regifaucium]
MFSIGDFAKHGRVSVRMLRHYDAIGLLRPAHVDPFSGYRSYTGEQLARLNRVIALKDLGFTLTQVQEILDTRIGVDELRGMLGTVDRLLRRRLRRRPGADPRRRPDLGRNERKGRVFDGEPRRGAVRGDDPAPGFAGDRALQLPGAGEVGRHARVPRERAGAGVLPRMPRTTATSGSPSCSSRSPRTDASMPGSAFARVRYMMAPFLALGARKGAIMY